LFQAADRLLQGEADGMTRFRLIGVGADRLVDAAEADLPTLFDAETGGPRRLAEAIDTLRLRHGAQAVQRGRGLPEKPTPSC
jgi:DNA polymerase-4